MSRRFFAGRPITNVDLAAQTGELIYWHEGLPIAALDDGSASIPRINMQFGGVGQEFVVDLVGINVEVKWRQSTFDQGGNDQATMGIGFFNGGGQIGVDTFAPMIATLADPANNVGIWTERSVNAVKPAGTTFIRVYQKMHKVVGSNNDGYIDGIELTIDGVPLTLVNPGAESASTIGWTNTLGGLGVRDVAPLPYAGTWYFTGGGATDTQAHQDVAMPPSTISVGMAVETDTAFPVTVSHPPGLGIAVELDTAFPITVNTGVQLLILEMDIIRLAPITMPASLIPTPQAVELIAALNWTPLTDIAGSVTGSEREALSGQGRTVRVTSSLIGGRQLPVKTYRLPSLYRFEIDAYARALRVMKWLERGLKGYSVTINRFRNQIEIGHVARIDHYPRFALETGFTGVVVGWSEVPASGQVTVVLIG